MRLPNGSRLLQKGKATAMDHIAFASDDRRFGYDVHPARQDAADIEAGMQRGRGYGRLDVAGGANGNRVLELVQRSPVRIMLPTIEGRDAGEAVIINTGGGVTGGDQLDYQFAAVAGARIVLTTQAAEKLYRAIGLKARISTRITVSGDSMLAWLPQESIVFNGAQIDRRMEIDIVTGAEVIAAEFLVLGRAAHGERLSMANVSDRWRVRLDGRLIWADTFRLTPETIPHLQRKALLAGCNAIATLVYSGSQVDALQSLLRRLSLPSQTRIGATCVNGLLVVRLAAESAAMLKAAAVATLELFSQTLRPGSIRVPRMWSC